MSSKSRRITVPALPARPGIRVKQLLIGLCFAALVISILWLRHSSSQNNSMSKELAATARFPAQVSSAANGPTRSSEAAQPDVQVPVRRVTRATEPQKTGRQSPPFHRLFHRSTPLVP